MAAASSRTTGKKYFSWTGVHTNHAKNRDLFVISVRTFRNQRSHRSTLPARNKASAEHLVIVKLLEACITASRQISSIAAVIICAGIVIGVLNITGVGVKITSAILYLSQGELWLALILTAIACLILGMEVPTTAAYIICVSVAGPILQEYGLSALHAHLFIFWFALLSTITPPVCGTVFIAAGMAEAPWFSVAAKSMKLGVGLYIIPFAFIVNSSLIFPQNNFALSLLAFLKISVGLFLISKALVNDKPTLWTRLAMTGGALIIIFFPLSYIF